MPDEQTRAERIGEYVTTLLAERPDQSSVPTVAEISRAVQQATALARDEEHRSATMARIEENGIARNVLSEKRKQLEVMDANLSRLESDVANAPDRANLELAMTKRDEAQALRNTLDKEVVQLLVSIR